MRLSNLKHQISFSMLFGLLLLCFFSACGSAAPHSSTTGSSAPTVTPVVDSSAAEKALFPKMTLVGKPTAKLISGHHTFEVDGKIRNGDAKQHDIYVQAELLNASGRIIGSTAFFNIDNVPGNATSKFAIQGTTMQPTWTSIQIKVVGLSENLGSTGGD